MLSGFYLFLRFAPAGLAMRGRRSEDGEAAALQGIRPQRVYLWSFGIGCMLAGLAGALMAPIYTIGPYIGTVPMLKAFIVGHSGRARKPSRRGWSVACCSVLVEGRVSATFINTTVATMISFGPRRGRSFWSGPQV